MGQKNSKPIIAQECLRRLAESRLAEAFSLNESGHYQAAIYLAGYAVECWLKIAICAALDWDELHDTFKQHDLMFLLRHSGLIRRISNASKVDSNFKKIIGIWFWDRSDELRYCDPKLYSSDQARTFLRWIADESEGVVPWLSGQVS